MRRDLLAAKCTVTAAMIISYVSGSMDIKHGDEILIVEQLSSSINKLNWIKSFIWDSNLFVYIFI